MSWAQRAKDELKAGRAVQIRPRGHSMTGRVEDGQLVNLKPCNPENLEVGDVVLVRVKGNDYLHLIKAKNNGRFLIGNNKGGINGWVGCKAVYGKADI